MIVKLNTLSKLNFRFPKGKYYKKESNIIVALHGQINTMLTDILWKRIRKTESQRF